MDPAGRLVERFTESLRQIGARLASPPIWVFLSGAAVTYLFVTQIWAWYRLRHIKGPFWASWSDFWLIRKTFRAELFDALGDLCNKHGPIVRIGPNYIACGDAAEVRRMWAVRSQFDRSDWYKGFQMDPPHDCTVSMRDHDPHHALRVKLIPGYSGKGVDGLQKSIDDTTSRFIHLLEEKYLSTDTEYRPVDFSRKIQYYTIDVISRVAFGDSFGFMDADDDLWGYIKQTHDSQPMFQMASLIPWLVSLLQSPLMKPLQPSDKDLVGLGRLIGIAKRVVGERFGPEKIERQDMLGSWIRNGLSQKDAEQETMLQILAGSDTTSAALTATFAHIVTNPDLYRRLQQEIDTGISDGKVSSPVTDAEAKELPLLQACIKEALRIWPPITGIMPKISDKDAVLCGVPVPAGTRVAWAPKACFRDKELFGEDADIYRPDRFLLAEPEKQTAMLNAVDLCFGAGRWVCLGRQIAYSQINKALVEMFRRFDFVAVNTVNPIKPTFVGNLLMLGFILRVSRRKPSTQGIRAA